MCGICGIIAHPGGAIDGKTILAMTQSLRHRGPDDGGIVGFSDVGPKRFLSEDISGVAASDKWSAALGHRRLSILDLAGGAQPMADESGRYWMVYNGEIYNYRQIRETLCAAGWKFRTNSDTEVLIAALVQWGEEALPRLEGMFAFALLDLRERSLFLARDRFGIKPLYYAKGPGFFAFGSEIKALKGIPGIPTELNIEGLRDFLAYRYVPAPGTIYSGIHCLGAGHSLRLNLDAHSLPAPKRWWKLKTDGPIRPRSLDEAAEELDALLSEVCRDHLISDVPVGVFLSGGLDSSAILSHAQEQSSNPLYTLNVSFPEMGGGVFNELKAAEKISKRVGSALSVAAFNSDILKLLPDAVAAMDEPMADPSILPVLGMMRVVGSGTKVMLSGDGGDEVFGGYNRYNKQILFGGRESGGEVRTLLSALFASFSPFLMNRYVKRMTVVPANELSGLLAPGFLPRENFVLLDQRYEINKHRSPLTQWQELDLQTYLVDDNLKKSDRLSMACGIELRVPLVDRRIVEFGFSLHRRNRFASESSKAVLRRSLKNRLPPRILNRRKVGFKVPLEKWLREGCELLDRTMDLAQPVWRVVRREIVQQWLEEQRSGAPKYEARLWNIIVLNEWLNQNHLP